MVTATRPKVEAVVDMRICAECGSHKAWWLGGKRYYCPDCKELVEAVLLYHYKEGR